jgi:hypothetical protein
VVGDDVNMESLEVRFALANRVDVCLARDDPDLFSTLE